MIFFYQISIFFYSFAIKLAALFNPKAKQWIVGRRNLFKQLEAVKNVENIYWFHCASLGEFEQGKPIIDKIKSKNQEIKILITFFSPSGYELRKDYNNADYVFYLPIDTPKNAKIFVETIKPKQVFFIKYEFWYYYLSELNKSNIPCYLISGVFRRNQPFFKWYGSIHRKMLNYFTHFFLQNTTSEKLINELGYTNTTVTRDTRIDRVYENSLNPTSVPLIKSFKGNKKLIIVGSSWQKEEKIIAEFIHSTKKEYKFIIAPHDINDAHIKNIEKLLATDFINYSKANSESIAKAKILIIDNIGILANIYQYTDIAFIGGGFTGALHNILEPASFGNVILFGTKHSKFHEATELLKLKGAFELEDADDLLAIINHLEQDNQLTICQQASSNYIKVGIGATELILKELKNSKIS